MSLFTGVTHVACFTVAFTGSALEDRDAVVPAVDAATGVELLQILIKGPLQVGQSGAHMLNGCAEAH